MSIVPGNDELNEEMLIDWLNMIIERREHASIRIQKEGVSLFWLDHD